MAKNISLGGYPEFIHFFKTHYPDLAKKFTGGINWSFINGGCGTVKPEGMLRDDFDTFRDIELRWLIYNGYIDQLDNKVWFVIPGSGKDTINKPNVIEVTRATDKTTNVKVTVPPHKEEYTYNVFGDVYTVKEKLGL